MRCEKNIVGGKGLVFFHHLLPVDISASHDKHNWSQGKKVSEGHHRALTPLCDDFCNFRQTNRIMRTSREEHIY